MSRLSLLAFSALAGVQLASAAPWVMLASDPGALSRAAAVNSVAAQSSFLSLVGSGNLVTFEGLTTGFPNGSLGDPNYGLLNINVGAGIVMGVQFNAGVDKDVSGVYVNDANPEYGFNATAGAATRFLRYGSHFGDATGPAQVTFSFNTATNYFSTFLTGTQAGLPGVIEVFFSDGTSQVVPFTTVNGPQGNLPKLGGMGGGVQFFALRTDTPISSVTFKTSGSGAFSRDLVGIDDIQYGLTQAEITANAIPEPGSILLVGAGVALVLFGRRKRSHSV